jgi:hypothetical protein
VEDASEVIRLLVSALDELGIDYLVGGSIASIAFGEPRSTRDVDFVLTVGLDRAARLLAALHANFYVDEVAMQRAIETGDCFNALDRKTVFQADIFVPKPSEWLKAQFSRRQLHTIPTTSEPLSFWVNSPEDVILNKLVWFRLGNEASSVQWRDAVGVIKIQSSRLDHEWLSHWAAHLGVTDLLTRALDEAS